jgi:hypothetical protein
MQISTTKRAKIGDICEIKTPAGLAYIQYTHDCRSMGALVRVLPGLFSVRPADFTDLVKQREMYFVFYTLKHAVRDGATEIVSHKPLPSWAQPHPLMRWAGVRNQNGKVLAWKLFKASDPLTIEMHQRSPVIRELTPEQERLSIHELWPHSVMVKEIARGWTPERAEVLRLQDVAQAAEREEKQFSATHSHEKSVQCFLYFPEKKNAEKAAERLRNREFSLVVRKGADGANWLVLVTSAPLKTGERMDTLRSEMEALASEFGGEYDGWELAV